MNRHLRWLLAAGMFFASFFALAASNTKTLFWSLPDDWEDGVSYDMREVEIGGHEKYVDIVGGALQQRYGLGRIGEPDLPTLTLRMAIPSGGSFVGAAVDAVEWEKVKVDGEQQNLLPIPIAEPVPYGAELVYPEPDAAAYGGSYPKTAVVAQEI